MSIVILRHNPNGNIAIALAKDESFFAQYMIPDRIEKLAKIKPETTSKLVKLTAKADIVAVVEGLDELRGIAKHVRFIRMDRRFEGATGLNFVRPKVWPRLRLALRYAFVPTVHAQGGFENAVGYNDEMAVANYSTSGSGGWIIRLNEIGHYLNALPADLSKTSK